MNDIPDKLQKIFAYCKWAKVSRFFNTDKNCNLHSNQADYLDNQAK